MKPLKAFLTVHYRSQYPCILLFKQQFLKRKGLADICEYVNSSVFHILLVTSRMIQPYLSEISMTSSSVYYHTGMADILMASILTTSILFQGKHRWLPEWPLKVTEARTADSDKCGGHTHTNHQHISAANSHQQQHLDGGCYVQSPLYTLRLHKPNVVLVHLSLIPPY